MNKDQNNIKGVSKNLIFGTSASTRGAYYHSMRLQRSEDPEANRAEILLAIKRTSWFERLWYPIFFLAGVFCLIFIRPITFELCFSVASFWLYMFANNLLARGKFAGLLLSITSASLYTVVSFFAKVYGEVLINLLLYIPLDVIAVITFRKNIDKKTDELSVRKMDSKAWVITAMFTIFGASIIYLILYFIPNQAFPLLNTLSMASFIAAMVIRNNRYFEFWWFNLFGNLISIVMWVFVSATSADLLYSLPFAISSFAALLNNIYGYIVWRQIYKKTITNGVVYLKTPIKIKKVITLRRRYNKALMWDKNAEEKRKKKLEKKFSKIESKNKSYIKNLRNQKSDYDQN